MKPLKFQIVPKNLLILLVLLLAAFLRLYKISEYMTFLGDEGRDVLVVYNILHGRFTLLGPTASVGGFFLGPIYYYFMTPFLWLFNYNPVGPAVMIALFGIATVWLVYKIGSEFFDKKTGIIASTLYAISPLVIAYSRSSWNPNLMPFFSLLTLYFVFRGIEKDKILYFFLSGILLGIAIQLHYLATFIGLIIIIYIISVKFIIRNKTILELILKIVKNFIYIFLGFIIGWFPFLLFEIRHGFPNFTSISNFVIHSGDTGGNSRFFTIIGNVFFRIFARLIADFPPPEQISSRINPLIDLWYYLIIGLALLVVTIFLIQYIKALKQKNVEFYKLNLLFVWFFLGIILFGFYKKPIYDYYFGFMFPLPFLLVGNGLSFLLKQRPLLKIFSFICFLALFIINIQAIPFKSSGNNQFGQVKEISNFVLSKTDNKPFNFALITLGNSDHAYRYFFELANKKPIIIENSQIDPQRKSATEQLLIVCEDVRCEPLGHSLWEVAGFGRAEIMGEWDVSVVKVYKLKPYKGN